MLYKKTIRRSQVVRRGNNDHSISFDWWRNCFFDSDWHHYCVVFEKEKSTYYIDGMEVSFLDRVILRIRNIIYRAKRFIISLFEKEEGRDG